MPHLQLPEGLSLETWVDFRHLAMAGEEVYLDGQRTEDPAVKQLAEVTFAYFFGNRRISDGN